MTPVYLAGLVVRNRRCVVLGSDREVDVHTTRLSQAGAQVTVFVDPTQQSVPTFDSSVCVKQNEFTDADLAGTFLVVDGRRDPVRTALLHQRSLEPHGFLLLAIDQPAYCSVTGVAVVRRGPLELGISTSGTAPSLASRLRHLLDEQLGSDVTEFVVRLGGLRERTPSHARRELFNRLLSKLIFHVRYVLPPVE